MGPDGSLTALFAEYADHHRHPVNRAAHMWAFPLLAGGALGLVDALVGLEGALLVQGVLEIVHLRMERTLGAWCTVLLAGSWALGLR